MHEGSLPTNAELMQAISALHAFTGSRFATARCEIDRLDTKFDGLDAKVDGLDTKFGRKFGELGNKIERLRYVMNRRFDHVCVELDISRPV